jgi:phage shock protein C
MDRVGKQLYRYPDEGMVSGVCAGLGRYFELDPALVRAAMVGLAFVSGFGFIAYLALWVLVDEAPPEDPVASNGDREPSSE